ncbi:hypothetical protein FLP41_18040 [Paracoccus marcusii]|uniref:hypothetical protein n=1 Tax=Paracoccus marcusii TaxID=59779 RepID=UPI002ED6541D|nr:hypothetical protein FLP41_18040 [Paracoccus marcusii]
MVWMDDAAAIDALLALPAPGFEAALNDRSAGVLGHLRQATHLTAWPIVSQIADRFAGPRTALIAEAAHVLPPSARRA